MTRRFTKRLGVAVLAGVVLLTLGTDGLTHAGAAGGKVYVGNEKVPSGCKTRTGKTGNKALAMSCMGAGVMDWKPDLKTVTAADQKLMLSMYVNLLPWCIAHPTVGSMKKDGFASDGGDQSHWHSNSVNPRTDTNLAAYAGKPAETVSVVHGGGGTGDAQLTAGVMYNEGWGLPHIGNGVRMHWHDDAQHSGDPDTLEMMHIWCSPNIEDSFRWEEPTGDIIGSTAQLKTALANAKSGGILAVSTSLKGGKGVLAKGGKAGGGMDDMDMTPTTKKKTTATTKKPTTATTKKPTTTEPPVADDPATDPATTDDTMDPGMDMTNDPPADTVGDLSVTKAVLLKSLEFPV